MVSDSNDFVIIIAITYNIIEDIIIRAGARLKAYLSRLYFARKREILNNLSRLYFTRGSATIFVSAVVN
jgi:hypothetical protein